MDDMIRIRIDSEKKAALGRFDALMESVDEQLDACDAPEPTVEDIVTFVDGVRA